MNTPTETRIEKDSMGELAVPADAGKRQQPVTQLA